MRVQVSLNQPVVVAGSKACAAHGVRAASDVLPAASARQQRRAERSARVARRGLHPQLIDDLVGHDAAVGYAVQRYPPAMHSLRSPVSSHAVAAL